MTKSRRMKNKKCLEIELTKSDRYFNSTGSKRTSPVMSWLTILDPAILGLSPVDPTLTAVVPSDKNNAC